MLPKNSLRIISAIETLHSSTAQTAKQNKTETSDSTNVECFAHETFLIREHHRRVRENCVKLQWTRRGNNRMEVVVEAHDVTDKEENVVETRGSPRSGENHMVFPVSGFVESLSRFGKMQMRANLKQIFVLTNFPPEFS